MELITSINDNTENLEVNMVGASAYSIHPNFEGAKAYYRCVQSCLNELEVDKKERT